jgi:hypothetical protein
MFPEILFQKWKLCHRGCGHDRPHHILRLAFIEPSGRRPYIPRPLIEQAYQPMGGIKNPFRISLFLSKNHRDIVVKAQGRDVEKHLRLS